MCLKKISSFSGKRRFASICSLLENKPLMSSLFGSKLLTHIKVKKSLAKAGYLVCSSVPIKRDVTSSSRKDLTTSKCFQGRKIFGLSVLQNIM